MALVGACVVDGEVITARDRLAAHGPGGAGRTETPRSQAGETWLMRRLLWRPLFLIYVTLAEAMVEARAHPASVRRGASYRDALVPLLALAALARIVIGLATAFWFAGVFVVAEATQSVLDPWVDVVGLSLGWTAALGMLASLVRMGIAWLLRRREDLLVRLRFVEPGKWDLVWQAVIGTCAALWALAGSGT